MTHSSISSPNFFQKPLAFIDVETTGRSASDGEICDIGVIVVDHQTLQSKTEFASKILVTNPLGKSESELNFSGYNSFTFDSWKNAPPLVEVMKQVADITAGCIPIGWNSSFDREFVDQAFFTAQVESQLEYHWLDVMSLAYELLADQFRTGIISKPSMEEVSKFIGLPPEPKPHIGINGAKNELMVYRELKKRLKKILGEGNA